MLRFAKTLLVALCLTLVCLAPAFAARFIDNGDQTVTDTQTGLTWTKSANLGAATFDFQQGLDYIAGMNAAHRFGRQDWRMPNLDELWSLVDSTRKFPALPAGHPFTNLGDYYWSSTVIPESVSVMNYEVDFQGGNLSSNHTWNSDFIWPVRGVFSPAGSETTLPPASTGLSYSQTLSATWGSAPYTYALRAGTLPTGLTLSPGSGIISGTASRAGVFSFTVRVTDAFGVNEDVALAITVSDVACSNQPVLIATTFFPDFPHAYAQAADGDLVRLQKLDFTSDLLLNRDLRLTLQGGYDCGYTGSTGSAGILGKLRVTSGTVKLAQLRFK